MISFLTILFLTISDITVLDVFFLLTGYFSY